MSIKKDTAWLKRYIEDLETQRSKLARWLWNYHPRIAKEYTKYLKEGGKR